MKLLYPILSFCLVITAPSLLGQSFGEQRSIRLSAQKESGGGVRLNWTTPPGNITGYSLRKKLAQQPTYGPAIATLTPSDTTFLDAQAQAGALIDYVLLATGNSLNPSSMVRVSLVASPKLPGRLLAVIDSSLDFSLLQSSIDRWQGDLEAEGWIVHRMYTQPGDSIPLIRQSIQALYQQFPDLSHLCLIGHVPVPYSGDIAPDGHNDHQGAWPTDNYYAELFGTWTDQSVQNTSASSLRNHNVPGDGKFDQGVFPARLDLALGRIDFEQMPAFGEKNALLLQYFEKNHRFRKGMVTLPELGVIDDNFQSFTEGFSAPAWRGFDALFGPQRILEADFFGTGQANGALWGYGCGAGTYTSAGGVGNSNGFASDSLAIVFNMLFGSYFGDWDNSNAFLRAPLASKGLGLTNIWSGRPYVYMHYMGSGETIGEAFRQSANGPDFAYGNPAGLRGVHLALMGDPSLRLHHFEGMGPVQAAVSCDSLSLFWSVGMQNPPHSIQVAVRKGQESYVELGTYPYGGGQALALLPQPGHYQLLVRPLYSKETGSGTVLFPGKGWMDSLLVDFPSAQIDTVWQDMSGNCPYHLQWSAQGGTAPYSFVWTRATNQTDTTTSGLCPGTYFWQVTDAQGCVSKLDTLVLQLPVGIDESEKHTGFWYPNPFEQRICNETLKEGQKLVLQDLQGRTLWEGTAEKDAGCIAPKGLAPGIYLLRAEGMAPERIVFRPNTE